MLSRRLKLHLTHWGHVTHIWVGELYYNLIEIMSSERPQAII